VEGWKIGWADWNISMGARWSRFQFDCRIQKCLRTVRIGLSANCAALALEAMKLEDSDSKTCSASITSKGVM
jgi:hypothetical protein